MIMPNGKIQWFKVFGVWMAISWIFVLYFYCADAKQQEETQKKLDHRDFIQYVNNEKEKHVEIDRSIEKISDNVDKLEENVSHIREDITEIKTILKERPCVKGD